MLEKNKILNFQHLINVTLAKDQDQNQVMMLVHALCVEVMAKLDLAKDFLQFNKRVRNVQDQEKKLQIHVTVAVDKEKNRRLKDSQFQFQKASMMERE